jgi:hypothetical protein
MDIRAENITTLDEVAKALAADPNAILELGASPKPTGAIGITSSSPVSGSRQ